MGASQSSSSATRPVFRPIPRNVSTGRCVYNIERRVYAPDLDKPPVEVIKTKPRIPPERLCTNLGMVEIPSDEFFPMWQEYMDSLLQRDAECGYDIVWEYVLADVRLQYVELLKLDGAVEIDFINLDEDDIFLATPCRDTGESVGDTRGLSWKVNNLGWVKVPMHADHEAHKVRLSNEWWIGLRNSFSHSIRSLVQYRLFEERFLRLFVVPVRGEDFMRAIVTSNMPVVLASLSREPSSTGAHLLSHCLISRPPGEFPATLQDVSDGTQATYESELYDVPTLENQTALSADASSKPRGMTFCRSDSIPAAPPSYDSVVGSAPPLGDIQPSASPREAPITSSPCEPFLMSKEVVSKAAMQLDEVANAEPSAPPLSTPSDLASNSVRTPSHRPLPLLVREGSHLDPTSTHLFPHQPSALPHKDPIPSASCEPSLKSKGGASKGALQLDEVPNAEPSAPPLSTSSDLASSTPSHRPLPLLVREGSHLDPTSTHLFPHQTRSVSWMLDVEAGRSEPLFIPQATTFGAWYAFSYGFESKVFQNTVDVIVAKPGELSNGGLLAHPVGSGKTVIAAELIRKTRAKGLTVVVVPGHIVKQWTKELMRFVPGIVISIFQGGAPERNLLWFGLKPGTDVVIVPHQCIARADFGGAYPYRLIVDEPQDIVSNCNTVDALLQIKAPCRWLLTATPQPLSTMMQLALGYGEDLTNPLPYDSMLSWFSRARCRRDPPFLCLPVPPLHIHMRAVTLLWQETSVVHSHALQDDLQTVVRLSSFFYLVQPGQKQVEASAVLSGAQVFISLDDWVEAHKTKLESDLSNAKSSLRRIEGQIAAEKTQLRQQAVQQEPADEDSIGLSQAFASEDEGVSQRLLDARSVHQTSLHNVERRLTFLSTINETVSSECECLICMNNLGGRVISMLPCLHSFCATCAARLFRRSPTSPCPVCRLSVRRREVCTFVCPNEDDTRYDMTLREKIGSKISSVIAEIERILRDFPDDKVVVFGQWHDLLRQLSRAMSKTVRHCFLDGALSKRCDLIEQFREDALLRVMLLSSESQSSGANLEVANHVIIIHPYCPAHARSISVVPLTEAQAFEQQAVGRVLRFPQQKEVHVYRFYSLGTPEEELYAHWGWAGLEQTQRAVRD